MPTKFNPLLGNSFLKTLGSVIDYTGPHLRLTKADGLGAMPGDPNIVLQFTGTGHLGMAIEQTQLADMETTRAGTDYTFWVNHESTLNEVLLHGAREAGAAIQMALEQYHFSPSEASNIVSTYMASNSKKEVGALTEAKVIALHHYFGHAEPWKIAKLISLSGRWSAEAQAWVDRLANCEHCMIHNKRIPHPKVALPRSFGPRILCAVDLKENTSWPESHPYILYMVCTFSRYTKACFIPDKKPETVLQRSSAPGWRAWASPASCSRT